MWGRALLALGYNERETTETMRQLPTDFLVLRIVSRGCPAASYFFASLKESNQRKGDTAIPEFPKPESARLAGAETRLAW